MAWLAHQTHVVTKGHCERCLASSREFAITFACPYTAPRRVLSETEGREVVEAALQLPDVQGLQANSVPADSALLPDARLEQIRQRLEGRMTYGGWSASGQQFGEHAHDDIAFLLAELIRLRAERDEAFGLTQTILGLAAAGDDPDDLVANVRLIHERYRAVEAARYVLYAKLEKLKAIVHVLASAPSAVPEPTG